MIERRIEAVGFVAYFRAKWEVQADGYTITVLDIRAEGDEVIYTSTATKDENNGSTPEDHSQGHS